MTGLDIDNFLGVAYQLDGGLDAVLLEEAPSSVVSVSLVGGIPLMERAARVDYLGDVVNFQAAALLAQQGLDQLAHVFIPFLLGVAAGHLGHGRPWRVFVFLLKCPSEHLSLEWQVLRATGLRSGSLS